MSLIRLQNIRVAGRHGVYESERREATVFTVNVELAPGDLATAARTDRLADTIDYARVAQIVREVIEGPSRYLLEALAGEILDRLATLGGLRAATVRVSKPQPTTMDVTLERVEVELSRTFEP